MPEATLRPSSFPARKLAPLAIVAVVAACNAVAWNGERAGTVSFAMWSMLPTLLMAACGAWWLRREEGDLQLLAPRWGDASLAIVCALSLFAGAWLLVHALAPEGSPREAWMARLYLQFGPGGQLKKHMVVVVIALLAIAIGEEVLWRGVVTRLLEPLVGSRRAWIVSAFLYALAHLPTAFLLADETAGKNPMLVLGALGAGLVWGGVARKLGRLVPGILAHVAFDWTVLVLFRLWGRSL